MLLFLIYILKVVLQTIKNPNSVDHFQLVILVTVVAYFAQANVSIDNIGVAIWGWIFLAIGYRLLAGTTIDSVEKQKLSLKVKKSLSIHPVQMLISVPLVRSEERRVGERV